MAYDQVRSNLWYTLRRHGIEIPYPIQVEYSREEQPARPPSRIRYVADRLAQIDLFAGLDDDGRTRLAEACPEHLFGAGERIVRQGDAGQSMFVVLDGRVRITLEPSGQEVAVTSRGGFFGEMSMLTGDPRTATVSALDDALLARDHRPTGSASWRWLAPDWSSTCPRWCWRGGRGWSRPGRPPKALTRRPGQGGLLGGSRSTCRSRAD